MAMKGHNGGNGNGGRGKQYGVILFLAFGAAIFGVMVLHKLRERRIFNLLVQDKDHQLLSLQIILQKERDYNKEAKRRTEEMKAKIYSLRTEKMELERKLLEMQSTLSSVKEEQKLMESTIREKLNEIKLLREKEATEAIKENSQVTALTESLKRKEAEIEELKQRLQNPVVVEVKNETLHDLTKDKEADDSSKNAGEGLKETITYQDVDGAKAAEGSDVKEENGENLRKSDDSALAEVGRFNRNNRINANESSDSVANDQRGDLEKNSKEDGESGTLETQTRGGMKLEMPYKSQVEGHVSQEKKWRILARNRRRASNLRRETHGESLQTLQYHGHGQQNGRYTRLRNNELQKLEKQQSNHSEGLRTREASIHVHGNVEVNNKHQQQRGDLRISEEGTITRKAVDSDDNGGVDSEANESSKQKPGESGEIEEQPGGIQEQVEAKDGEKGDQKLEEEEKVDDKYEDLEETVVETKTVERNSEGSESKLDEEQEDSEEETEESEF